MQIEVNIDIQRKPEDVFPWIAEPNKAKQWQNDVSQTEILGADKNNPNEEIKVGTKFREVMSDDGGGSLEMIGEITKFKPNEIITFHLESKIHIVDVDYQLMSIGTNTEATTTTTTVTVMPTIRWKFPMNIVTIFFGWIIKNKIVQQIQSELIELKRLCEDDK